MDIPFERIEDEYRPTPEDDDAVKEMKDRIFNRLTDPERIILIWYAELGTYAALARKFHNSVPTVKKKIEQIRQKLC